MKKLIGYVALAMALLMAGACQKEASSGVAGEAVKMAFTVMVPDASATDPAGVGSTSG